MAYLYQRPGGRVEIREAHATRSGPRSRTLASFRGALTSAHLETAEARALRPFDRAALIERARRLGIGFEPARADPIARELLARLRRGAALDPRLAELLRRALEGHAREELRSLEDVAEWVGATDAERGRALRDVLRLYDGIASVRPPVRERPPRRFPRFRSRRRRRARSGRRS